MRKSGAAIIALVGAPVILAASSAAALTITLDQVTATAGGAALGAVGGPIGGLVGGVLGKELGKKIHPPPRQIDLTDLESRARVTPIENPPMVDPAYSDRVVDSTPIREIGPPPSAVEARAYLASAPRSHRWPDAVAAEAIPASAEVTDAKPGTLDYQLDRLNARRAAVGEPVIEAISDPR